MIPSLELLTWYYRGNVMSSGIKTAKPPFSLEENNSGRGRGHPVPRQIKGWSWGAFLLNWVWAIGNQTWIGLLSLVPYVGIIFMIILGFKGREWAWRNRKWEDLEHFNRVQRLWSVWAVVVVTCTFLLSLIWILYLLI
ncbi:hypothetical protein [Dongshaea marina]|uniref:hypothetical protein n=1 Tax=Dongshaea marina TaxID=2047966 RepID=UPI00131EDC2E|nr:hypothetical protein [Dongshaea marina]